MVMVNNTALSARVCLLTSFKFARAVPTSPPKPTPYFVVSVSIIEARLVENQPQLALELELRRRVLVLSEVLSRSGERRSPKRACVGVRGWVAAVAAQARDHTFGRGVGSLRQGRTRLSEYARNTSFTSVAISPKRGPVA
ncbi:hypothetical protein DEO72_LG9g1387 [Vigna unguiculata]|uniref:Uncharacterized protein n=1 Tax=Vigna unguiculata TaxID=3917 RepID=A0A4D6N2R5_VIGUN|nr:hypothetical protein DEO72_LG9g1387 [Vigna unguiculata]